MQDIATGKISSKRRQEAYRRAERVIREHSRTFFFASNLLPLRTRRAIRSLYGFCRSTDDLVDRNDATVEDIERWRSAVSLPAVKQSDPILLSWAVTREEFGVERRLEQELIDGVRMDVSPRLYPAWKDLEKYCYLVASTVGLLSLPIIGLAPGVQPAFAEPFAVKLGVALQLTNILRDVGEDAERGRVYLPLEDLAAHNLTAQDIFHRVLDSRFESLMKFEIRRTRSIYLEALPGIALLSREVRLAVETAALLYRSILDEIENLHYDVFSHRAHLSSLKKLIRMPGILAAVISLRAPRVDSP
jgi:phytoene synthase